MGVLAILFGGSAVGAAFVEGPASSLCGMPLSTAKLVDFFRDLVLSRLGMSTMAETPQSGIYFTLSIGMRSMALSTVFTLGTTPPAPYAAPMPTAPAIAR